LRRPMKWTAAPEGSGLAQSWVRRRRWVAVEAQALAVGSHVEELRLADVPAEGGGHLIVEVWQARGLPADPQGAPPDVAVRVSCDTGFLDGTPVQESHTTATRRATREPCWGIEGAAGDAQRCRHHFALTAGVWARIASTPIQATSSYDSAGIVDDADDFVLLSDSAVGAEPMLQLEVFDTKDMQRPVFEHRSLAERVEERKAPRQSTTFGRVHIPLRTVLTHHSCDGWHLLVGGEGEVRIGWLLLDASAGVPPTPLPSPNEVLQVKAWQKADEAAAEALAAPPVAEPEPEPEQEPEPEPEPVDGLAAETAVGVSDEDEEEEDGARLELTISQKARRHTPVIRSGHYNESDEMVTEKWDSIMPWLEWRGNTVQSEESVPCFADPQGFTVPLRRAHEWQVPFCTTFRYV
jgi:hypothetical protein